MESQNGFSQANPGAACDLATCFGPEMDASARSCQPKRKKKKQSSMQDGTVEAAPGFGVLALAANGTTNSKANIPSTLEQTALHDHAAYCIPKEAAALKNLVRDLKDTVSRQSELLLSLRGTTQDRQKQHQELQEKAKAEKRQLGTRLSQLEAENQNLQCRWEQPESWGQPPQEKRDACSRTVLSLSKQLREQRQAFSLESVKGHRKWLRFYTGFDGYPRLKAFLDFLRGESGEGEIPESGPLCALSPENQLFLVLVRLRLGLLLQDLAFRFCVSESTASRYWVSWTELMERKLREVPVACSRRYIDAFKPQHQLQHHDMRLVALDCAKLLFEAQGRTRSKGDASQGPRAHYSTQGYALAAPSGFLTFSTGTSQELPTLPPFLQAGHVELTGQQKASKRQVLSLRSLIDKTLGFRFLRLIHPQNMEDQVGRAWVISCYLACLLHEPMGLT